MSHSHGHLEPRVLISYARADGEEISQSINELLVSKDIPVWQDKVGAVGMEGGKDWWQQITKAIDRVEFLVLVATKAALESKNVKREWLYARQQGVCVYPVKASPHPDYSKLPRWMKKLHFYDLEHEQQKFINDLNTRCETTKVPFMAGDMPDDFVNRPDKVKEAISYLVDRQNDWEPIPGTVALHGAGGFGKTTLLKAICHSEKIRDVFDDGVLWATIGQHPTDLLSIVVDLIEVLSEERPGFHTLDTAVARLKELLSDLDCLIVIDDVWNFAHLEPFLEGGSRCARLISTRNLDIIPKNAKRVHVDAMTEDEGTELVRSGLLTTNNYQLQLSRLAIRLGEWPLLLKLVNRALYHRVTNAGQPLQQAIEYINAALDNKGLTSFDVRDATSREQAVAKTLGVGIDLLAENERERYAELAVFAQDADIPLSGLQKLWSKTGGFGEFETEDLCDRLSRLSLVYSFNLNSKTVRLHDVIRKYLLQQYSKENLSRLHGLILDSYANALPKKQPLSLSDREMPYSWEDLDWAQVDDYGLRYLSTHAYELRDNETYRQELYKLICKPFMQEKLIRYGSYQSFAADVELAIEAAYSEEPPNLTRLVEALLIRNTVELLTNEVSNEMLWVWARLNDDKKALGFAALTGEQSKRIPAYLLIARALLDREEIVKARSILLQMLREIQSGKDLDAEEMTEWLRESAVELLEVGEIDRLLAAVNTIRTASEFHSDNTSWKDSTLTGISEDLAKAGYIDDARKVAERIEGQYSVACALCITAEAYANTAKSRKVNVADMTDCALKIANSIERAEDRVDVLSRITNVLAKIRRKKKKVIDISHEALALNNAMQNEQRKVETYSRIARALASLGEIAAASKIIHQVSRAAKTFAKIEEQMSNDTLKSANIALNSTTASDYEEALKTFKTKRNREVQKKKEIENALLQLGKALVKVYGFQRALEIAKEQRLGFYEDQKILSEILLYAISEARKVNHGLDIVGISKQYPLDLQYVAKSLAQMGDFEKSIEIVERIGQDSDGARELCQTIMLKYISNS
jgi:hypothetical protein